MVEDDDLKTIECMFNRVINLVICRRCDVAIAAEHIGVHVNGKHGLGYSEELARSIISKYQLESLDAIIGFKNRTEHLETGVDGIPIERG